MELALAAPVVRRYPHMCSMGRRFRGVSARGSWGKVVRPRRRLRRRWVHFNSKTCPWGLARKKSYAETREVSAPASWAPAKKGKKDRTPSKKSPPSLDLPSKASAGVSHIEASGPGDAPNK